MKQQLLHATVLLNEEWNSGSLQWRALAKETVIGQHCSHYTCHFWQV